MAEEVLNTWELPADLVLELIASDDNPLRKVYNLVTYPNDRHGDGQQYQMKLRLEDANGNEVVFPVRLISDTTVAP